MTMAKVNVKNQWQCQKSMSMAKINVNGKIQ